MSTARRHSCLSRPRQSGVAAMLILFVIAVVAISLLVSAFKSSSSQTERDKITSAALVQAKAALIGYAARATTPGRLPCPENPLSIGTSQEGSALGSCTLPAIGRLPWRTLGLTDLRDGYGERLWYAISPGFGTAPINSDTPAQLTIDGVPNSAVAIVFAAGTAINGQIRPPPSASTPPDVMQYLEGENNNGDNVFVTTGPAGTFNDQSLPISHDQLFAVVEKRVIGEVRNALVDYFAAHQYYPRPASFADGTCLGNGNLTPCGSAISANGGRIPANPTTDAWDNTSILRSFASGNWFQQNGWREVIYYAVAPACIDGTANCNGSGFLTVNAPPSVPLANRTVVLIAAGRALANQNHGSNTNPTPKKLESNYLEEENLTPLNDVYTLRPLSATTPFNDKVRCLPGNSPQC